MAEWHEGQFSFSESALRQALESEGADIQTFKMEVERISIRGMEAPKPKLIDLALGLSEMLAFPLT